MPSTDIWPCQTVVANSSLLNRVSGIAVLSSGPTQHNVFTTWLNALSRVFDRLVKTSFFPLTALVLRSHSNRPLPSLHIYHAISHGCPSWPIEPLIAKGICNRNAPSYFCASASRKRVVLLLGHAVPQENASAFKIYRESVLGHACFSTPPTMRRWSIHAGQGWR